MFLKNVKVLRLKQPNYPSDKYLQYIHKNNSLGGKNVEVDILKRGFFVKYGSRSFQEHKPIYLYEQLPLVKVRVRVAHNPRLDFKDMNRENELIFM